MSSKDFVTSRNAELSSILDEIEFALQSQDFSDIQQPSVLNRMITSVGGLAPDREEIMERDPERVLPEVSRHKLKELNDLIEDRRHQDARDLATQLAHEISEARFEEAELGEIRHPIQRNIVDPIMASAHRTAAAPAAQRAVSAGKDLATMQSETIIDDMLEMHEESRSILGTSNSLELSRIMAQTGVRDRDLRKLANAERRGDIKLSQEIRTDINSGLEKAIESRREKLSGSLEKYKKRLERAEDFPLPRAAQDILMADDWESAFKAWGNTPITAPLAIMMNSSSETAVSIASGAVGAFLGGFAGGPKGSFAGAFAGAGTPAALMTYNSTFLHGAAKRGIPIDDVDGFIEGLRDPEVLEEIHAEARDAALMSGAAAGTEIALATKFIGPMTNRTMRTAAGNRRTTFSGVPITGRGTVIGEAENIIFQTAIQATADATAAAGISQRLEGEVSAGEVVGAAAANISTGAVSTPATVLPMRAAAGRFEQTLINELEAISKQLTEDRIGEVTTRVEESKQAISDILEGDLPLSEASSVVEQFAAMLEDGRTDLGGVDTVQANLQEQLELLEGPGLTTEDTVIAPDALPDELTSEAVAPTEQIDIEADITSTLRELMEQDLAGLGITLGRDSLNVMIGPDDFVPVMNVPTAEEGGGHVILNPLRARRTGGEASDLIQVTPEIESLIETLRDPDNSLEGMQTKLEAIHEAYEQGLLYDSSINSRSARNRTYIEAIKSGDISKALTTLNAMISSPDSQQYVDIIRSEDAALVSRLVGVDKDFHAPAAHRGDEPGGPFRQILDLAVRGTRRVYDTAIRAGRAQGTRGAFERIVHNIKGMHEQASRVLLFRLEEHKTRTNHLFGRDMTEAEVTAVNRYMREPTKARAEEVRSVYGDRADEVLTALRERRLMVDNISKAMINSGVVAGPLAETLSDNVESYLRTAYSAHMTDTPLGEVTPQARTKLKALLAEKYNGPILRDTLDKLNIRQLRDHLAIRGLIRHVEGTDVDTRPVVVLDGNTVALEALSKDDIVSILSSEEHIMTDEQLNAHLDNLVLQSSRTDTVRVRGKPEDKYEDGRIRPGDKSRFKKAKLSKLETDMAEALREALGELTHPNDVFIATAASMVNTLTQHNMLSDIMNFLFENDLATLETTRPGMNRVLRPPPGMDTTTISLRNQQEDGSVLLERVNPFHVKNPDTSIVHSNGIHVNDQVGTLLENALGLFNKDQSKFMQAFLAANGLLKLSYTVLNLPAHPRNIASAGLISMRNGIWPSSILHEEGSLGRAFRAGLEDGTTSAGWTAIKDPKNRAFIEDLVGRGLLHDGVRAGTLADLYEDIVSFSLENNKSKTIDQATSSAKRFIDKAFKAHSIPFRLQDEVIKVSSYMTERVMWADILYGDDANTIPLGDILADNPEVTASTLTPEMLAQVGVTPSETNINRAIEQLNKVSTFAADISKAINPTYSKTSPFVRGLRKFPFIGPFPAFAFESYRTQANSLRYMGQLFRAGFSGKFGNMELSPHGRQTALLWATKKLTGTVVEAATSTWLKTGTGMFLAETAGDNIPEEFKMDILGALSGAKDTEHMYTTSLRALLPDYQKNLMMVVSDVDHDTRTATFFDLSRTHPSAPQYEGMGVVLRAVQNYIDGDEGAFDGVMREAIESFLGPFISVEPGTQNIVQMFNELFDPTNEGVSHADSGLAKAVGAVMDTMSAWVPPYLNQVKQHIREKDHNNWYWQMAGVRFYEVEYDELARAKAFATRGAIAAEKNALLAVEGSPLKDRLNLGAFNRPIGDPNSKLSFEEVKDLYLEYREREATAYSGLREAVESLRTFGMTNDEISDFMSRGHGGLKQGRPMSEREILEIVYNNRLPVNPVMDDEVTNSFIERAVKRWGTKGTNIPRERAERNEKIIRERADWLRQLDRDYLRQRMSSEERR